MLTSFALMNGRATQQPIASCFPAYPETLSHHLRQWVRWPASESLAVGALGALFAWPLVLGFRLFTIKRSSQGLVGLLIGIALMPAAALWYLLVLRQIRFSGIATCARQKWVTREQSKYT